MRDSYTITNIFYLLCSNHLGSLFACFNFAIIIKHDYLNFNTVTLKSFVMRALQNQVVKAQFEESLWRFWCWAAPIATSSCSADHYIHWGICLWTLHFEKVLPISVTLSTPNTYYGIFVCTESNQRLFQLKPSLLEKWLGAFLSNHQQI